METPLFRSLLFSCLACSAEGDPLCPRCQEALVPCPPLCSVCGSLGCPGGECQSPWKSWENLASIHSGWLALGQGLEVLRAWKYRGGPRLLATLLSQNSLLERLKDMGLSRDCVVVPVGQTENRSWALRRNPARELALGLARRLRIPIHDALSAPQRARRSPNEMKTLGQEPRHLSALSFALREPLRASEVVLVDDIRTTGRTLRAAGQCLAESGASRIHYVTLGFRPALPRSEPEPRE